MFKPEFVVLLLQVLMFLPEISDAIVAGKLVFGKDDAAVLGTEHGLLRVEIAALLMYRTNVRKTLKISFHCEGLHPFMVRDFVQLDVVPASHVAAPYPELRQHVLDRAGKIGEVGFR